MTVSLGVATFVPNASLQVDDVIRAADEALYRSKREGRDRSTTVSIDSGTNDSCESGSK